MNNIFEYMQNDTECPFCNNLLKPSIDSYINISWRFKFAKKFKFSFNYSEQSFTLTFASKVANSILNFELTVDSNNKANYILLEDSIFCESPVNQKQFLDIFNRSDFYIIKECDNCAFKYDACSTTLNIDNSFYLDKPALISQKLILDNYLLFNNYNHCLTIWDVKTEKLITETNYYELNKDTAKDLSDRVKMAITFA